MSQLPILRKSAIQGVYRHRRNDTLHEPNVETAYVRADCAEHGSQPFKVQSPKVVATNKSRWFTVYCPQCLKEAEKGKRLYSGHRASLRLVLKLEVAP